MKKKSTITRKWLFSIFVIVLGLFFVYVLSLFLLIRFPYPWFPYKLQYQNFSVHSDQKIDGGFSEILDDTTERLAFSEFYEPDRSYRIFLCNDVKNYSFFASLVELSPKSQGFNVQFVGNIFLSLQFIKIIQSQFGTGYKNTVLEGSVAHILTHEIAHTYNGKKLGYFAERKLPLWKNEGYAEYTAAKYAIQKNSVYEFIDQLITLVDNDQLKNHPIRRQYIQSLLIVTYLAEIKNMTFQHIVELEVPERELLAEIKEWYLSQPKSSQ